MRVKVLAVLLLLAAHIGAVNGEAAGINIAGPTSAGAGGQNITPCEPGGVAVPQCPMHL